MLPNQIVGICLLIAVIILAWFVSWRRTRNRRIEDVSDAQTQRSTELHRQTMLRSDEHLRNKGHGIGDAPW